MLETVPKNDTPEDKSERFFEKTKRIVRKALIPVLAAGMLGTADCGRRVVENEEKIEHLRETEGRSWFFEKLDAGGIIIQGRGSVEKLPPQFKLSPGGYNFHFEVDARNYIGDVDKKVDAIVNYDDNRRLHLDALDSSPLVIREDWDSDEKIEIKDGEAIITVTVKVNQKTEVNWTLKITPVEIY